MSHTEAEDFQYVLNQVPDMIERVIADQEIKGLASKFAGAPLMVFLGRGISSATAMKARLKLLEISYMPSVAYPAGESKHGPISLIEPGVPVIFFAPRDSTRKTIFGNIMEMNARGGTIISVIEEGDEEIKEISDEFIEMPSPLVNW